MDEIGVYPMKIDPLVVCGEGVKVWRHGQIVEILNQICFKLKINYVGGKFPNFMGKFSVKGDF